MPTCRYRFVTSQSKYQNNVYLLYSKVLTAGFHLHHTLCLEPSCFTVIFLEQLLQVFDKSFPIKTVSAYSRFFALKSHSIACSFHRQTSLSSLSCYNLHSDSTTAPGSTQLRRLTLRVASKHLLMLVSVDSAVQLLICSAMETVFKLNM